MVEKIKKEKVVLIGSSGMLGSELSKVFPRAVKLTHDLLDITNREMVFSELSELRPSIVINVAAYTDVEGAETEADAANLLNSTAVSYLAEACKQLGSVLVHYSTDYVFDGTKSTGYGEDGETCPLNEYGRSKLAGEANVRKSMDDYYIIRTSWLFGCHGKNFVDTILKLADEKSEINVVNDQFGCPTYAYDLAVMTKRIVDGRCSFGIYHLMNDGVCSWFEFAREIVFLRGVDCCVVPCSSDEYPSQVRRPKYSILNNNRMDKMPHWKDALKRYLSLER